MGFKEKKTTFDLVVVGAGLAGLCAAIQAARKGVKVALVNDRGVLGGNASAEIGVFINGANDGGQLNLNSREGGICSEIMLEYKYRTPARTNQFILDGVFLDFVYREKNIEMFLNTCIDSAKVENGLITSVSGTQNTTETRWILSGKYFVDNTGDGALGAMVGAEYMKGRESKDKFNELIAPDVGDAYVLPSTLMFSTKNVGYKVPFVAPDFAFDIPKTGILERRDVKGFTGKWYYEIGGEYDHVDDREDIIKDHKKLIFGIWDYLKNSGEFPECDNYDFDYISTIPGTREYRRLVGDYILTENDIRNQTNFDDTVGHGGWNIDLHAIKGIFDEDLVNRHIYFDGVYKIPYRTGYSKNIDNLFMCGRCMSSSHVAFGTTRVMGTLSTLGQAVGMAAFLCVKYDVMPRDIYKSYIKELQQELLRDDQLIIGVKNEDENDKAKTATVTASSTRGLELDIQKSINYKARLEEITPQFRPYYESVYSGCTELMVLSNTIGLTIPVTNKLDSIKLLVKSDCETELDYNAYLPKVTENYGPDQLVNCSSVTISPSDSFEWVELPVGIEADGKYVFILLSENPAIKLAIGGDALPTTTMFTSCINNNPSTVHISTLKMAERTWERSSLSICYKTVPEQPVFKATNVINGFNRAYGQPNMWLSEESDANPELSLTWNEPVLISQLQITFAIDTTKRFYTECVEKVFNLIAQDYNVYAVVGEKEIMLAEIRGNFKKMNRIDFDEIKTNNIRFRFLKSPTNQIGVYEIRAY